MSRTYAIGVDYGTNSVRAVIADCSDGHLVGTTVFNYPSGEDGVLLDARVPHLARQNPADYLAGLQASVSGALDAADREAEFARDRVIGIGVDTTRVDAAAGRCEESAARARSALAGQPGGPRLAVEGSHLSRRSGGNHRGRARARAVPRAANRRHVFI